MFMPVVTGLQEESVASSSPTTTTFFAANHILMPWLCLERCQFNSSQIREHIAELYDQNCRYHPLTSSSSPTQSRSLVNAIAFEKFNLGPNATLVHNTALFNASREIDIVFSEGERGCRQLGKEVAASSPTSQMAPPKKIAMVSSYPYPADFLIWMRQLFRSDGGTSEGWIQELAAVCSAEGIAGVNIDFEPPTAATKQDALDYAQFLSRLRVGLWGFKRRAEVHPASSTREEEEGAEEGLVLTATTATWSTLWNLTEIASAFLPDTIHDNQQEEGSRSGAAPSTSALSRINKGSSEVPAFGFATTMNTYTFNDTWFERELKINLDAFGTPPSHTNGSSTKESVVENEGWRRLIVGLETWPQNFTKPQLVRHFELIHHYNICRLAVWKAPIPPHFWAYFESWASLCDES